MFLLYFWKLLYLKKPDYTKMYLLKLMSFYGAVEFGKILVIAKKTIFKGCFPRTFVIENTNFQVRWQRKNKPMREHQDTKNPWDAFTSFVLKNHLYQSNWVVVRQKGQWERDLIWLKESEDSAPGQWILCCDHDIEQ